MSDVAGASDVAWPLQIDLQSTSDDVRGALEFCDKALADTWIDDDCRSTTQLILAEALNNIVEHAYEYSPDGAINLLAEINVSGLAFCLRDGGRAMPGLKLPDKGLPDNTGDLESLPEGGFGWFLIRQLTTELNYARENGQNVLTFRVLAGQDDF